MISERNFEAENEKFQAPGSSFPIKKLFG